jgi:hypothetical protein
MENWRKGYRRVLAAWLMPNRDLAEPDDDAVNDLILREARLIEARTFLARVAGAVADLEVAARFELEPEDVHAMRIDLERNGELEIVDCG